MEPEYKPIPLYAHTVESLCDELVSGRAVPLDDGEDYIKFDSVETRAVFSWYCKNKDKWAGNNTKANVEKIVDTLMTRPPVKPVVSRALDSKEKRCLHLRAIRAHRFAGIHKYGSVTEASDDFEYCFEKSVTLIEGKNGSGKTALLNAIVWCLTGKIYRSQRKPEKIEEEIEITTASNGDEECISKKCTAITPVPEAEILKLLKDTEVPLDTWVELTFVDDHKNEVRKVKRSLSRSPRGKIRISESGFDTLGVDPIALEVGTSMAGLIPYIQLEEASDMGKAIAALTPLRALEDLVKDAKNSQGKLKGGLKRDREKEIEDFDREYSNKCSELKGLIEGSPTVEIGVEVPEDVTKKDTGGVLREMRNCLAELEAKALEDCKRILGEGFDAKDPENREDLRKNVGKALGLLGTKSLGRLASAQRLGNLGKLTTGEIEGARALIDTLLSQASEIEELVQSPERAVRERLYARIGAWIRENSNEINVCPICQEVLGDRIDKVTGKKIVDHLKEHAEKDKEYLAKAIKEWGNSYIKKLKAELPSCLSSEMENDLPRRPVDLIAKAFGEELFDDEVFKQSLSPLRDTAQTLCKNVLDTLAEYKDLEPLSCSDYLQQNCKQLCDMLGKLNRALCFWEWRKENGEGCKEAFDKIIGRESESDAYVGDKRNKSESRTLLDFLLVLDKLVKNATPLHEAQLKVKSLRNKLRDRRKKERRIRYYSKAEKAIEKLLQLEKIVDAQIGSLMSKLSSDVMVWKGRFYQSARVGVPEVAGTDIGLHGSLLIGANVGGTRASARHISNTSDLRATLLAVLISFWKQLMEERGGLSLILLDDLQELFDSPNRRRVANSIPEIVDAGGRVIVTTNDRDFEREVARSCKAGLGDGDLDRREIHALSLTRCCITLGKYRTEIERKRKEFENPENENEDQPARDYIKDLRIYLDERLHDFFNTVPVSLPRMSTLSDSLNVLRGWRRSGQEPFANPVFEQLLNAPELQSTNPFMVLMNKAHHKDEHEITYYEVNEVRSQCVHVLELVENAYLEYERWLQRDLPAAVPDRPSLPGRGATVQFSVPMFDDLAAATRESGITEIREAQELFTSDCLGAYAVYVIHSESFGFAAEKNCRAIVRLDDEPVDDNSLVIALHGDKVYARRFLQQFTNPEVVGLSSEDANPMNRAPSLLLPTTEVRLLKVVGIIFDGTPVWPRPSGEASLADTYRLPVRIEIAFKVRGVSALPLALPNQKILGAHTILASELKENKGVLVALAISGEEAFKRVGECVPGQPRLRKFESIGGLGDSIVVRTEAVEDDPFRGYTFV